MIFYSAHLMIYKAERKVGVFPLHCVSQFDKVDTLHLFDSWGIFMHTQFQLNLLW